MVLFSFFILAFTFVTTLLSSEAKYTTFSSPNNKANFVVIESFQGKIYQMSKTGLFMKNLAKMRTDDVYQPFSEGAYELEWNEPNELVIRYAFNYMTPDESAFSSRFSPFVNERNIAGITYQIEECQRHIEQNVNAKMVFFDFALKLIMLLKQ